MIFTSPAKGVKMKWGSHDWGDSSSFWTVGVQYVSSFIAKLFKMDVSWRSVLLIDFIPPCQKNKFMVSMAYKNVDLSCVHTKL